MLTAKQRLEKFFIILIYLGLKRVRFHHIRLTRDDLYPQIPDIILHSEGFKSVKFSGRYSVSR